MIPIISVPTVQTQAPIQAVFAANVSSDPAIGRLPFQSVAASVAVPEANNNTRGNPQPRTVSPVITEALSGSGSAGAMLQSASSGLGGSSTPGFSSLFLAQLFGQKNIIQDGSLMQSFLGSFSPSQTIDYNTMIAFSRTKYKPSNAAVPRLAESSQPLVSAATEQPDVPSVDEQVRVQLQTMQYQQQEAVQRAPTVNTVMKQVMQVSASAPVVTYNAAPVKEKAQAPQKAPQAFTTESLIRTPQGFGSYVATAARNTLNLMTNNVPQYQMVL